MTEEIWISTTGGHASNLRPFRHDIAEDDPKRFSAINERMTHGEPITSEDFPKVIFATRDARDSAYNVPYLFRAYGYWLLSESACEILSKFALGDAMLSPVTVLKRDRETPVAGNRTCINFGNLKATIVPEQSPRMMETYIRDGRKGWIPPFVTNDRDIAVLPMANDGPDIWKDPATRDCFFLSGRLASTLREAKADKGFFLARCRLVEA